MTADTRTRRAGDRHLQCLWAGLCGRLEAWRGDWRTLIDGRASGPAGTDLLASLKKSDRAIFGAFAVALLSGNTRWHRIARIREELEGPFQGFDPKRFAALSDEDIEQSLLPWFRERKAGAAGLAASLSRLRLAAAKLSEHTANRAPAQAYLRDALGASDGTPEGLAITLGMSKEWKLPGFGVALAAEALRMLDLDLCKPDRHILRAVGAWSLVAFRRWHRRSEFTPPAPDVGELRATMLAVRAVAAANGTSVSYANSVIWTAGAVSGARLTNEEFEAIGRNCGERHR